MFQILYQDDYILVVSKPSGLLFHPNWEPERPNLVAQLKSWLRESAQDDYLGTHQRLDQDTSGVVLLARHRQANRSLARQFEKRSVTKVYHALVAETELRPVQDRWTVRCRLGRKEMLTVVDDEGKPSRTDFAVLQTRGGLMLVEARPYSGRRHQIRVHLAAAGLPIVGDQLYGGVSGSRTMLHSRRLQLEHPISGEPLSFEAEYPPDFIAAFSL